MCAFLLFALLALTALFLFNPPLPPQTTISALLNAIDSINQSSINRNHSNMGESIDFLTHTHITHIKYPHTRFI
jgi:hypothetical protein